MTVVINGLIWDIVFVHPYDSVLRLPIGDYTLGACDNYLQTIFVCNDLQYPLLKKVIAHEITHAVMFSYNINLDYYQEELFADLIATYGTEILSITNKICNKKTRG